MRRILRRITAPANKVSSSSGPTDGVQLDVLLPSVCQQLCSSPLLRAIVRLLLCAACLQREARITMRPLGRMLAKIMHASPLAVAEQLIRQVGGLAGATSCWLTCLHLMPGMWSHVAWMLTRLLARLLFSHQVMGMPGMVISTVESLVYLTPMAYDVVTFAILKQLASPKKKLKVSVGWGEGGGI